MRHFRESIKYKKLSRCYVGTAFLIISKRGECVTDKEYIENLRIAFSSPDTKDALSDTQLLMLLLSYTKSASDIMDVVGCLVTRFGSVRQCFFASKDDLMAIDKITYDAVALIRLIGHIYTMCGKDASFGAARVNCNELFKAIANVSQSETFWAAVVDEMNSVTALECLAQGEAAQVGMNVGAVVLFAGRQKAKRVVLAHFHPSMERPNLSRQDIITMQYIGESLQKLGITLVGQSVITKESSKFFEYAFD